MTDDDLQLLVNEVYRADSQREAARNLTIPEATLRGRLKMAEDRGIKPRVKVKATRPTEADRPTSVVWFTDAHNMPGLSLTRFKWLAALVNDIKPDYLVDGGDFDDMNSLCGHEGNETWKGRFKPAFVDDLMAAEDARALLSEEIKVPVIKEFILGNHEDRLYSFENRNPEVYGMMQHAYIEIQDRHGWRITPYRGYLDIGGVDFTHVPMNGMNKPVGGKRAAIGVSANSVRDVCFGHTHSYGYWDESKFGPNRSVIAINGGCFMPDKFVPNYAKGSAKAYWYGAHVLKILHGRIISHQPITMLDLMGRYA